MEILLYLLKSVKSHKLHWFMTSNAILILKALYI